MTMNKELLMLCKLEPSPENYYVFVTAPELPDLRSRAWAEGYTLRKVWDWREVDVHRVRMWIGVHFWNRQALDKPDTSILHSAFRFNATDLKELMRPEYQRKFPPDTTGRLKEWGSK